MRTQIRTRYDIAGGVVEDFCTSCCCPNDRPTDEGDGGVGPLPWGCVLHDAPLGAAAGSCPRHSSHAGRPSPGHAGTTVAPTSAGDVVPSFFILQK